MRYIWKWVIGTKAFAKFILRWPSFKFSVTLFELSNLYTFYYFQKKNNSIEILDIKLSEEQCSPFRDSSSDPKQSSWASVLHSSCLLSFSSPKKIILWRREKDRERERFKWERDNGPFLSSLFLFLSSFSSFCWSKWAISEPQSISRYGVRTPRTKEGISAVGLDGILEMDGRNKRRFWGCDLIFLSLKREHAKKAGRVFGEQMMGGGAWMN